MSCHDERQAGVIWSSLLSFTYKSYIMVCKCNKTVQYNTISVHGT